MSSHHFVREGQEPAVWVLGTEFSEEILGTLLEWSPIVIVTLPAVKRLLSLQIKIDRILSAENDEDTQRFFSSLYPIEWVNTNDIYSYLWKKIEEAPTYIYITGLDNHQLQKLFCETPEHLRQYIIGITLTEKWICPPAVWTKWLAKGQVFSLSGKTSDWSIQGKILREKGFFLSGEDQLLQFKNLSNQCFIEHLQILSP